MLLWCLSEHSEWSLSMKLRWMRCSLFCCPPPPDGHFTSLPQRGARHPAGCALPGELLLTGGGETQQARGGSSVSVTVASACSSCQSALLPNYFYFCSIGDHVNLQSLRCASGLSWNRAVRSMAGFDKWAVRREGFFHLWVKFSSGQNDLFFCFFKY